jgi:hypothetical protein
LLAGALAASLAFSCTHGASPSAQGSAPDPAGAPLAKDADDLLVVDCLLPGRVTKLGRKVTYLSPRRPVKTTAIDCEIRGGEYVSHDRADYRTALKVWQESAEQGDATAQNNVGEIYERGLGVAPDYTAAASWYGRAAEQGNAAAQLNLGQLYERGLGVPKDPARALALYEQARGVEGAADSGAAADAAQIAQLRADLEARDRQTEALGIEIQRLREELAREQREAQREDPAANERERQRLEEQRAALASERLALEAERRTLERQSAGQAASARESAEVADAAAERSAALERREAELDRGFAALAEREQKMAALGAEAASLGADAERKREQLAQLEQQIETLRREREERRAEIERLDARPLEVAALAAPSIRMIEPSLLAKRGVGLVEVVHASGAEQLLIGHVQAPAGLAQLTVNGAKAEVDGHGIFEQRIPVDDPETKVSIVATDEQGLRETLALVLKPRRGDQAASEQSGKPVSFGAPPAPALPPIDFGHYTALVIGNDNYRSLPDLDTARADAEAIGRILRSRYQFEVVELYDATRYEILSKLNELRGRLTEKDNLLIYYAGHGQLDEVNNRGHWQPVDAELESTANWLSNIDLTDILNAMSAKHVLVVADSCYAGTLTRSSLARLEAGMTPEALAERRKQMVGKRSRTALTSGGLSPVLDAGGGGHSIFAKALIKVLEENDSVLEAQNLAAAISALVAYAAEAQSFEQMPEYAPLKSGGHEAGDFFFVPAPPSV